jgi:hypothetical protein
MSKIQPSQAGCRLTCPIFLFLKRSKVPNHKCVYLDQSLPQRGDKLSTFGYPQSFGSEIYTGGDSATTEYEGESFQDGVLILKLKAGQIQEGFSGSPLLNERTKKVCGIVSISRNTESDLGGRATPTNLLFQSRYFSQSQSSQNLISSKLKDNLNYHQKIDKTWNQVISQSFLDRKTALSVAAISTFLSIIVYLNAPTNQLTLAALRLLVACGFGYSVLLYIRSLNLNIATVRRFPVSSLTGSLTTILVFGLSFLAIPDNSVVLRNLTGINEYPTLGLIEKELPLPLKKALDITNEPILDTHNPVYEAIQAFRDESGNISLMSEYKSASTISSAFNQNDSTVRKGLAGRGEGKLEKIRQNLKDFESEPMRFLGERQEFYYTTVLLPLQTSLEDAGWTAFLPLALREENYEKFGAGSILQYPKLSDVEKLGRFTGSGLATDNTWLKKILDRNPEVRGFLAFTHRYLIRLSSEAQSFVGYLFLCGYEGINRIAPTPYVRFVDIKNSSLSSVKIDSVRIKTIEKDRYELTPIFDRDRLFQDITAKDESLNISVPPGLHLLLPIEFGFDTRLSKSVRRGELDNSTGKEVGNKTDQNVNTVDLINRNLYLSKLPRLNEKGFIDQSYGLSANDIVDRFLNPTSFTKDFIGKTKNLRDLSESVPNRFAVGSLRNVVTIRINGKDIQADNPLNDPRFSMSVYFAYGSCPYLIVYDSQKGYWIEFGTVITGQQGKAQKNYEIHSLGNHPSKFRIEERDKEITYLDAISILYTDVQSDEEKEIKSQIPELNAIDENYFILHQDDALEVDLKKLLPSSAINVRLKVEGFYEVLPGVIPMHLRTAS